MSELQKKIDEAAAEIALLLQQSYTTEAGIHAETVISAAAAITGEWSLWASGAPVEENAWVIVPEATNLLVGQKGSADQLVRAAVAAAGGDAGQLPGAETLVARVAVALGGAGYPPLSVGQEHYPLEWSPLAAPRFRSDVRKIAVDKQLPGNQSIFVACVLATCFLISGASKVLDPVIGGTLALELMVGVSRMSPSATESMFNERKGAS